MSLHADVAVPARDRRRLERLCRYVARPPIANHRLEERADGRLTLRLKTRWRDGTTHILMERSELIERLVPLIPPPRAHQVRYHGVLAPAASQRDWIVPGEAKQSQDAALATGPRPALAGFTPGEKQPADSAVDRSDEQPAPASDSRAKARRMRWARLLQRVFEIDALRCPHCGSTLRLVAAIEDPAVARKILECLALPARAPPLEPAVATTPDLGQSEHDWLFDQSPVHDEA
jgi:hypothetical protein